MAEIDVLEVKIKASAQSAAASLNNLAKALKSVRTSLSSVTKDGETVTQRVSKGLNDLNNALNSFNTSGATKLNAMADALNKYADALQKLKGLQISKGALRGITNVQDALITQSATVAPDGGSADVEQNAENIKDVGDAVEEVEKKTKKTAGVFGKFIKSISRIALYRAIRSALKAVGEAFSEGLKNAYMYSKQSETFTRLADTLDRIKSITSQMKNQLGAMWGEIKQFIMPAVEWIVGMVRSAAEHLTELFAAINGEDTYLRAKYVALEWEEATDAVKKYKNQLLSLDELNNLTTQDSGNKKSETDYANLYDEVAVNEKLKPLGKIREAISSFASDLSFTISDVLFNWDDLDAEQVAQKIIVGVGGLIGGVVGFSLGGVPGAIVGTITGVTIGMIISTLSFGSDGSEYSKKKLRKILYPALGALVGAWIGFKTSGLTGALVGMTVGATLGFILSRLSFSKDSGLTYSKDGLANQLIASALVGIMGAFIGFKVGGIAGALVGLSIGATVGLVLNKLFFSQETGKLEKSTLANQLIGSALVGIMGGLIGFAVGGIPGALIGMSIGVTLTMLIKDVEWKTDDGRPDIFGIPSELLPNGEAGRIRPGGINYGPAPIEQAAGGVVQRGSYFVAGEAGPEFVGSIGGTSAVANTSQMTDAIYKAAYMGMSQALKENGGNGLAGYEPATMDDLYIAIKKKSNAFSKRTGTPSTI